MQQSYSAFFYGTLMHPKILQRVIGNSGSHLEFCPAVLFNYTRHNVKGAEYPGIVSTTRSSVLFDRELSREESSVRGTLVKGLTRADIAALDVFEGDEYARNKVQVHPLDTYLRVTEYGTNEASLIPAHPPPIPQTGDLLPAVEAETYVYLYIEALEPELWSFEDFVKMNAWKWYGKPADENEYFTEVDRRRANGTTAVEDFPGW